MSLRNFFYLHKSDRLAMLFLLILAVIAFVGLFWAGGRQTVTELTAEDSLAIQLQRDTVYRYSSRTRKYPRHESAPRQVQLSPFDPNTADANQLRRLGLKDWQVRNILKYRAHGGRFCKASDFSRIYGMTEQQYEKLLPYIQIRESEVAVSQSAEPVESHERDTLRYPLKLSPGQTIKANFADTAQLRKVPGIGRGYAARIVRYRNRLGGFYRVEQLLEIEGFPESALPFFELGDVAVRRIDINKLSLNQLKAHPYINYLQARAIIDYRRLHGSLQDVRTLSMMKEFTPEEIARLKDYLQF